MRQTADLIVGAYVPGKQLEHSVAPMPLMVPLPQFKQELLAETAVYSPSAQSTHEADADVPSLRFPGLHASQLPLPWSAAW